MQIFGHYFARPWQTLLLLLLLLAGAKPVETQQSNVKVPGVIIDYLPASAEIYVGSPSIAILPDGTYVASHDEFGPASSSTESGSTRVFVSGDRGQHWQASGTIKGAYWSSLFVHRNALYLIGVDHEYGNIVVRRSDDHAKTWTVPADERSGLIARGHFHCAPVPVIEYHGRIWRAVEDTLGDSHWGLNFHAMMLSAPAGADLLDAGSWTLSNRLAGNPAWLGKTFGGWLEGNAVVAPDGTMTDVLRVDVPRGGNTAAVVHISDDGSCASFDPNRDFIDLPGGAKKFAIRYDSVAKCYWSLTDILDPAFPDERPGFIRNTLALIRSTDLRNWSIRATVLHHPDRTKHGFQYVDWVFDGDDMVFVSRTAFDDDTDGAHNMHDANYFTFHRLPQFRKLGSDELNGN